MYICSILHFTTEFSWIKDNTPAFLSNKSVRKPTKNNQDVQEVRRDLFATQIVGVFGQVGREIDAKDVETYLEVSHPTVVGLLSGLESRGLVSCVFDSDDKRMKSVYITDEGSALLKSSRRDAIDVGKEFWEDISEEEIETLIAILEKLKGNLNND